MASPLQRKRCLLHAYREAVAQCPECQEFYCRECVTEHQDRWICASCLQKAGASATPRQAFRPAALLRPLLALGGLILAWFLFYQLGDLLLRLPSAFHEGLYIEDYLP